MIQKPTDAHCPKSRARGKRRGRHRWPKTTPAGETPRCVNCGHPLRRAVS